MEYLKQLTENEKIALGIMDWEYGKNYSDLKEVLNLKKSQLVKIIKRLKELELISVGSLVNLNGDQGGYFGRGWTLTSRGRDAQNCLYEEYFTEK